MASIKQLPSGSFQLSVKNRLLPKTLWATFDSFEQADAYATQIEALLAQGIVPATLLEREAAPRESWFVARCMAEYIRENDVPVSEVKLLDTLRPAFLTLRTDCLNYDWAEGWVRQMKRSANLAPSTIRHRAGALSRCFDWMARKHPAILAQNPLRLLKRGFSAYSDEDRRHLASEGKTGKYDTERDRRLDVDEEARILTVLEKMPNERAFFVLALESAMRMRECYTLDLAQISLLKRTIHLERTKNGDNRQVPITSPALATIEAYAAEHHDAIRLRGGRLFPYWNGDRSVKELDRVTAELSYVFREIFARAKVLDFKFHDLRHEATCRLYEKTNLPDVLIAKVTGHRDLRTLKRYASLRGSDLAVRLW